MYNWQHADWPQFRYQIDHEIEQNIYRFMEVAGKTSGLVQGLPENIQIDTMIDLMVIEAMKTSEIEGEYLSRKDVLSSIKKNLGIQGSSHKIKDKRAEGMAKLMVAVREAFVSELTENTLSEWHKLIFNGNNKINAGSWRAHHEPMQIVSGAIGKEIIHFEAPPSDQIPKEMSRFIDWFNSTVPGNKNAINQPVVRSAIAHLYFESIHPFEDGNGRIGRAISEKALSQTMNRPLLFSLSKTIESNKNQYYEALKEAQRNLEITPWISYFIDSVIKAQKEVEEQILFTLQKSKFFDEFALKINDRQQKVLRRMFQEGPDGFKGGMTTKKYVSITKTSKATATRDLQFLVSIGALISFGEGRGRKYKLESEK